ncbi:MAG: hypothetical protein J6P93_05465 [Alphaproteobacteria bacterium]|nr:hypothetical protein [Alphaproteobacteria bacterium]
MKDLQLSNRIEESLEMLQALSDEGLIVVPAIPTETMISAAKKISNLSEKEIRKIYFTMTSFADEEVPISTN